MKYNKILKSVAFFSPLVNDLKLARKSMFSLPAALNASTFLLIVYFIYLFCDAVSGQ